MTMTTDKKASVIKKYETHQGDTGSPEVQVALISARISELNKHFETHKKDHTSRHGLLKLVGQRRRLLNYLKTNSRERYTKLITELGLRK